MTYFTLASRNYASLQIRSSTDFSQGKHLVFWSMFMSKNSCLYSIWKYAYNPLKLSVPIRAACSLRTVLTPTFTTPTWIKFWLNNQSYFEGWFSFMHKTRVGFYKQKHSFKSSWALFRDGETPRWHVLVKRGCPGFVLGALVVPPASCHASCAWLGWEAVKVHPLKGSADHLLPPCSFLLVLPLLSAARKNCSGGTWIKRSNSPRASRVRELFWAPK